MQSDEKRTYKPNRPCARMTNCPSVSPSGTIKFLRGLYIIHFDIIIIFNEPRASRHLVEEMRIKNFHKGDDLAIRTPALWGILIFGAAELLVSQMRSLEETGWLSAIGTGC